MQDYLHVVERLLSPDLIILGGGVSKKADRFLPYVKVATPVVPAVLQNNAGIVGAAMAATGQFHIFRPRYGSGHATGSTT